MTDIVREKLENILNVDDLIKKYGAAKNRRSEWNQRWQFIQEQVYPEIRDYTGNITATGPKKITNTSGRISGKIDKIVSFLASLTADPSTNWLHLMFSNTQLDDAKPAQDWLYNCTQALYRLFSDPECNFYPSSYAFYRDWYTIGTACREIILRKDKGIIHFSCVPMNDIYVDISGYGDVQTVYRSFSLTARQAIDMWGDNISDDIFRNLDDNTTKYEFFETVMLNPLMNDPDLEESKIPILPYLSCVIEMRSKNIVAYNQHALSPYIISRFFVKPGDIYGLSKVWFGLPCIKMINHMSRRIAQGVDFTTFPMMAVRDKTALPKNPVMPGAIIQGLDMNGRPQFMPMPYSGDNALALQMLMKLEDDLDEILGTKDMFPADNTRTAYEAAQIKIEKNIRVRPQVITLQSEDLNKTVKRALKLLEQLGMLPQFPYEALRIDPNDLPDPIMQLRVSFSGEMETLQKMYSVQNMDMLIQKVATVAQFDPAVIDKINMDNLLAEQAKILNVPPSVINPDEIVQMIREERAKQQQAQQEEMKRKEDFDETMKLMNLQNQTKGGYLG